ncbi:hypothetical protein FHG87_018208 [Trinorchestia longiramus]|nr:hypothetical protein FHG87_018208 [Trinorchestia longiramus]
MGVDVMQTKKEVFLERSAHTKALLSRFGIDKANSVTTPVDVNADLVTTSDEVEECDKDLLEFPELGGPSTIHSPAYYKSLYLPTYHYSPTYHTRWCTHSLYPLIRLAAVIVHLQATVAIALDWPFIPEAGLA